MSNLTETEAKAFERSYIKGDNAPPPFNITIGNKFDESVAMYPKRLAVSCPHQNIRWTYEELSVQVNNLASGLISLGLEPGDKIGVWSANRSEWIVAHYAAAKLGLILVGINAAYCATEFEYAVNLVECKALIMADKLKSSDYVKMLQEVAPELSDSSPGALVAARLPSLKIIIKLGEEDVAGCYRYSDVLNLGTSDDRDRLIEIGKSLCPQDKTFMLFTSGTTAGPKGVVYDHYQLLNSAYTKLRVQEITYEDSICLQLPLFHILGICPGNLTAMISGAKIVYSGEFFDPETMLSVLESEKCTVVYGVPTLFKALVDFPGLERFDLTSLRTGLIAGTTVPFDLAVQVTERLHIPKLINIYGMTEFAGAVSSPLASDSMEHRLATVGKIVPNIEIKLIDPSGNIVPVGSPGELCARGFIVLNSYYGDPAKSANSIDSEGWFRSGDLATVDADGYFEIVGRIKDIIIRGGENIPPGAVEECLMQNPNIQSAVVVAVPDDKFGEEICACILLKPGASMTEEEVKAFCKGKISYYKIPRYVLFIKSFPVTASGKIRRHILQEQSCGSLGIAKSS